MNVEQQEVAADPQSKLIDLSVSPPVGRYRLLSPLSFSITRPES